MNSRMSRPQAAIIPPEQALTIKPFGIATKVFLGTEATRGAVSVIMAWHRPGEGPPDHIHFGREEMFFVIDGTYEVTVGEETTGIGAGTMVYIPRNTVHRFKNIGLATACMLDWCLPGGQDHYFRAISDLAARGEFTGDAALEVGREFDTTFIRPRPWRSTAGGRASLSSFQRASNQ